MKAAKGFTLIEFILYFALVAVVTTTVTIFTVEVFRSRNKAAIVAEVDQNSRFVLLRVDRSIRMATSINSASSTFDSDNGVLVLNMDTAAKSPTVFSLSGGAVTMMEGTGSAIPLTDPGVVVTKLRFSKDALSGGGKTVTLQLTTLNNTTTTDQLYNYTDSASTSAVIRKN